MLIINGDIKNFNRKIEAFYNLLINILNKYNKYLLVYHADCDGIVSAIQIYNFLSQKNLKINLFGVAQFRNDEYNQIIKIKENQQYIIFLEGYGMSNEYKIFNDIALNIDHHPIQNIITNFLNPREFHISPNPANALLVYELLKNNIDERYKEWVALASIMDYCEEAAENLLAEIKFVDEELIELKNIFYAIQYNNEWCNYVIKKLNKYYTFKEFIKDEKLQRQKIKYLDFYNKHFNAAQNTINPKSKILFYSLEKSQFRIASSLANRLSDLYADKIIIIAELDNERARLSVRNRTYNCNIGEYLKQLCEQLKNADATGHEKAASARINKEDINYIIKKIEEI
ncbi:MAG TPA: DHH family phosphoesterase [bacterium]|nr:DHH family phosphoesterase [bacterium]HOL46783.1 DHH family phosphoesterase [bacterium]HPQ17738.1 DHH family phosphoesterase [bacterium]